MQLSLIGDYIHNRTVGSLETELGTSTEGALHPHSLSFTSSVHEFFKAAPGLESSQATGAQIRPNLDTCAVMITGMLSRHRSSNEPH